MQIDFLTGHGYDERVVTAATNLPIVFRFAATLTLLISDDVSYVSSRPFDRFVRDPKSVTALPRLPMHALFRGYCPTCKPWDWQKPMMHKAACLLAPLGDFRQ